MKKELRRTEDRETIEITLKIVTYEAKEYKSERYLIFLGEQLEKHGLLCDDEDIIENIGFVKC